MEVVYALVSRGTTVLAEYTGHSGNFETVTRLILRKIETASPFGQIKYDAYTFHYKTLDSILYMCMTHADAGSRMPLAFLREVADSFREKYGVDRPYVAIAYEYDEEFSVVLKDKIQRFRDEEDVIHQVKQKLDETRDELVVAIESLLERGEKIELLVDKTERMTESAYHFERSAKNLKSGLWWKRCKTYLFLILIFLLFAAFVAVMACGISFKQCRHHH